MDPITAIVAAIAAGATTELGKKVVGGIVNGFTEVAKKTIGDAYEGLKGLLKRKFGADSGVVKAVDGVEAKPVSAGRKMTLKEELAGVEAGNDQEIVKAAQDLLALLETQPGGKDIVNQSAQGIGIIQISGDDNIGTVSGISVSQPKE